MKKLPVAVSIARRAENKKLFLIFCSTFVSRQKWNKEKNRIFAKLNFTAMHTAKANSITIEPLPLTGGAEAVYYFHSDHLGSASWITNNTGLPVQHLLYLPFGEHFVNEHSSGYDERFAFTGKERDAETGYYYHGARFNSSDIGWLSVDPMADKYPSISPYAYCAWNPVKLVDPEGEDWETIVNHENKTITIRAQYAVSDEDARNSAEKGVNVWNELSGQYSLRVDNGYKKEKYTILFDLSVIDESEYSNDNPSHNLYYLVNTPDKDDDNALGSTMVRRLYIKRTSSDDYTVSAHEIGHSLGLLHNDPFDKGLMEEDGGRKSRIHVIRKNNIMDIINFSFHPELLLVR